MGSKYLKRFKLITIQKNTILTQKEIQFTAFQVGNILKHKTPNGYKDAKTSPVKMAE